MADFKFSVSNELKAEGVKVKAAIFSASQVVNRVSALENEKKDFIRDLRNQKSPILDEYENLHVKHAQPNFPPPAEALISLIMEKGRFPNINCVVDSYNLVSAQSFLSIGAHDLDKIKGSLSLKIASGNELYIPLGSQARQKINQGEYVCMDEEKVICWLDIRQCEQTKITKETKNYLAYLQGNKFTSEEYLAKFLQKVIDFQLRFCKSKLIKVMENC